MTSRISKRANFAAIVAMTAAGLFATSTMAASFQVLHSFAAPQEETPAAPTVQGADGFFYGVAAHGGDVTVLPLAGGGETMTVTTLDDVSDFSGLQQVSDLPGPDGRVSFREAVTAANNTPGAQTIAFAIPPAEFWLVPDVGLLRLEQGAFFLNDSGTTVDFSTQTANMGDTNPNGPEIGIYGLEPNGWGIAAIFMNGDNSVVKGLGKVYQRGYAVRIVGDNNRVIGCQINGPLNAAVSIEGYMGWPAPSGNIVGGTAPGEGNTLTGLVINGPAEGNIVIGNTVIGGVTVQGATQYGVIARNNRIGGPTPAEGNVISGAGYYGEEGFPVGEQVSIVDADGTIVEGNYIGTTADGMARYPQQIGPIGVEVRDSRGTTIRGNLIAGLRVVGVDHYAGQVFGEAIHVGAVNANTDGTVIQGNTIGVAADGVTPIVTRSGIIVSPLSSFYHAFRTLITSNHIARVETTGVFVASLESGVTITRNSIHDCGDLGIDLGTTAGADGPTPNDPGDGDTGGNGLQNFPVLLSAATTGSTIVAQGTLDSSPNAQFTVEFFVSPSCDPSGFGEGAAFIGSATATTDGAGHAAFSLTLPAAVAVGAAATATATRLSTGDTSEFSACVVVTSADSLVANASATPTSGSAPLTVQFSSAGSSDPGGTIVSYFWSFGDGGNSTTANPSHTYTSAGTYTAMLTVTDNNNASASATVTIIVNPASNTVLRSTAIDLSATQQGKKVAVTGNIVVKDGNGAAVSGAVVSATWAKPGGTKVTQTATTSSTGIAKFSTTGGRGTYTLTVSNITKTSYTFDAANSVLSKSITR
jgi:PKD repeat protein